MEPNPPWPSPPETKDASGIAGGGEVNGGGRGQGISGRPSGVKLERSGMRGVGGRGRPVPGRCPARTCRLLRASLPILVVVFMVGNGERRFALPWKTSSLMRQIFGL